MTDVPWDCPVDPPCPHSVLFHDWEELGVDPSCCVDGCSCSGKTDEHTSIHRSRSRSVAS